MKESGCLRPSGGRPFVRELSAETYPTVTNLMFNVVFNALNYLDVGEFLRGQ